MKPPLGKSTAQIMSKWSAFIPCARTFILIDFFIHRTNFFAMFSQSFRSSALVLVLLSPAILIDAVPPSLEPRQLPAAAEGVTTITSPSGVKIRYKEPGKAGVCETTKGVKSYSGYVDLAPDAHTFFWFFEARHNPADAPLTLWLNGGPGSDSLIGLFQGKRSRFFAVAHF